MPVTQRVRTGLALDVDATKMRRGLIDHQVR
jgi:hypothetical protein